MNASRDVSVETGRLPRVYIVIVHFGPVGDTLACLESLLGLDYADYRIVVVDNDPEGRGLAALRSWALARGRAVDDERLVVLDAGGNRGFAGASNLGMSHAAARGDASYCWLLNNDTIVAPDALTHLVQCAEADPRIGFCGSTLLDYAEPDRVQALGGGRYHRWLGRTHLYGQGRRWTAGMADRRRLDFVHGASLLVRQALIDAIGPLDESYFLYFEDLDWAMRARGSYRLAHAPGSRVWHRDGGSSAAPAKRSAVADYHAIRSRIRFTARFNPAGLPTVYLGLLGALAKRAARGQWDRFGSIVRLMMRPG